jgi:hypothetical protein
MRPEKIRDTGNIEMVSLFCEFEDAFGGQMDV